LQYGCSKESPGIRPGLLRVRRIPHTYKESDSAPGRIRTSDSRFRKPLLYPLSYRRKARIV
jgi:hypothetical protein